MAAIWSAIKGTSDHQHHDGLPSQPAPSRSFPGASSQSPRSPSSVEPRGSSPAASAPLPAPTATGKRTSSSRLSRHSTALAWREKDREADREHDADSQNADDATKAASPSTVGGLGSSIARATPPPPVQSPATSSAIDPLSQHIFLRTNTDHSIPQRLRHSPIPDSPTYAAEGPTRQSIDTNTRTVAPVGDVVKDKSKKGPSFLSRLGMRGIKKKDAGGLDSDSEIGSETRMDGSNAVVFGQSLAGPFGGAGFTPHHKEPPRYIRTKANNKRIREFNRMFLAQELVGTQPPKTNEGTDSEEPGAKPPVVTVSVAGVNGRKVTKTGGAIWATEFSKDGKYFATAGRDHVLRIWAVISTPEERRACEEEEAANGGTGERLSAPVFRGRPIREFEGHTGEVLDLSWSKNNFLLSSSMDKTVRLWHISRTECLCTFKHKDFVTRLAFHPQDDRFFLAGSLDTMLRLWSIPDKAIAYSEQLPDLVTAVAFSPDGRTAIAGLLNGLCLFYDTDGLKFQSQVHVRSSRGKNAKGSKITNIQTISVPPPNPLDPPPTGSTSQSSIEAPQGEVGVLITSNDSRIRIYSLREKTLDLKLKGHENSCSQIAASFSDDGKYVICGSEDRKAFIWSLFGDAGATKSEGKPAYEYFDAHGELVTTAVFAPTKARMLLGQSGDPLYDLCNPPPVVLRSLEEAASAAASQTALSVDETPPTPLTETTSKKPEPSAGYIARSTHYDGNIIVTTDDTGIIKVFRQDCAFAKRRNDTWETNSTLSRKLTAHGGGFISSSGVGRSASILTRTSASSAAHSRRGSLSQSVGSGVVASPKFPPHASSSDRILSWRQSIEHGGDRRSSGMPHDSGTPTRSERSVSPTKGSRPFASSGANLASDARKQPYGNSSPATTRPGSTVASPTTSVFSNNTPDRLPLRLVKEKPKLEIKKGKAPSEDEPTALPTPSFTFHAAAAAAEAGQDDQFHPNSSGGSGSFWNLSRWRGKAGSKSGASGQGPAAGHTRAQSGGSLLSRSPMVVEEDAAAAEKESDAKTTKDKVKDRGGRRQSAGLFGSASPGEPESDRRRSLPPSSLGQGASDSDIRSIPTIHVPPGEEEAYPGANPVQLRRDASPYRHLWSRGNSTNSRQSSEISVDIEEAVEEAEEEEDEEETLCKKCGGREFKVRKVAAKQRLSCCRCGTLVD